MEINPSLTPAGMVNTRSEEWGEARTVEQGEQSSLGVPAFPEMWWNRPKQDVAGLLGLPSWLDLQPPAAIPAAGRVLPSHCDLEEADPIPWAPQQLLQGFLNLHQVTTSPRERFLIPLGNAKACKKQGILRVGENASCPVKLIFPPSVEFRASCMLCESCSSRSMYFLSYFSKYFNISFCFSSLAKSSEQCQLLSCHLSPPRGCRTGVIRIHMAPPRGESLKALAFMLFMEGRKAGNAWFSATVSFEGLEETLNRTLDVKES